MPVIFKNIFFVGEMKSNLNKQTAISPGGPTSVEEEHGDERPEDDGAARGEVLWTDATHATTWHTRDEFGGEGREGS